MLMEHDNAPQDPRPSHASNGRANSGAHAIARADACGWMAEHAGDQLTAIAHELGNLLDGTIRYVGLARRGLDAAPDALTDRDREVLRQLGSAEWALGKMSAIVHDSLTPGGGSLANRFHEPRPLVDAVIHACDVLRPLADEQNVSIDVEFSPRLVLAQAGPIYTVISNAVRNSIEAMTRGGNVHLICELVTSPDGGTEVQIDVLDDGPGVAPHILDDVFDVRCTTKRSSAGVGLALSREIMQELGGEISMENRPTRDGAPGGAHLAIRFEPLM